jgi:hypothetical protein
VLSFREFLNQPLSEAILVPWKAETATTAKAIQYLNAHCKDGLKALVTGGMIYRGFKGGPVGNFVLMDSTKAARTSRDSNNLYQLMLDNAPSMATYPSRTNSFICTTSISTADEYSKGSGARVMIPIDGTKIAVSRASDFLNESFALPILGGGDFNQIGMRLARFLKSLGIMPDYDGEKWTKINKIDSGLAKYSVGELTGALTIIYSYLMGDDILDSKCDVALQKCSIVANCDFRKPKQRANLAALGKLVDEHPPVYSNFRDFYKLMSDNSANRFSALSAACINPKDLHLRLVPFGAEIYDSSVECWFSGKCIAISRRLMRQILIQLLDEGNGLHEKIKRDFEIE